VTDTIRQGRQIQVTDAKTGEDVTPAILTQIVLEEARKKKFLLPPPLLYLIIQYGENVLTDFLKNTLNRRFEIICYSVMWPMISSKNGLNLVKIIPK